MPQKRSHWLHHLSHIFKLLLSALGLKKTSTCTEHLTAGICESHKVDVGEWVAFGEPRLKLAAFSIVNFRSIRLSAVP